MKQREIKFRTPKRTQLPNGGSELVYFSLEDLPDFKSDDLKKVILGLTQQYTGLKDKNGKEVYEGDILELKSSFGGKSEYGQVYWDEYTAGFDWKISNIGMNFVQGAVKRFTVVGNIYENSNLLTKNL